jgi:hypothetical protein
MYKLTLTAEHRQAIDWVGHRYSHGSELFRLLWAECQPEGNEIDWESAEDITFELPEHIAWEVHELIERDDCACLDGELAGVLWRLCESIV